MEQTEKENREKIIEKCQQFIQNRNFLQLILCAEEFLQSDPQNIELLYILAWTYVQIQDFEKAGNYIVKIRACEAGHIGAAMLEAYIHQYKKEFVQEMKLLEDTIAAINEIQLQQPDEWQTSLAEAWSMLGSVYTLLGKHAEAIEAFLTSSRLETNRERAICEYSNALFAANYIEDVDQEKSKVLYAGYTAFFSQISKYTHSMRQKKKLRIGYISPDFRQHPVAFFVYPLLHQFSAEKFEVYAYGLSAEDAVTQQLKTCTQWKNLSGMDAEMAAEEIYHDQIDILVDLSGHTKNNALPVLAYQPAPLQISGIGYFNTTGMETIQYFLTDGYCDPAEGNTEAFFTEKLYRLPKSHFCYTPFTEMPLCADQIPYQQNQYITFGSLNNFNKVTDRMLLLWQQILDMVPASRMLLKSQIFDSQEGCRYVKKRIFELGADPERFIFEGFTQAYLSRYHAIDIALDTSPYTGGITTCEALYMGVPVISLCGSRHGARFGYSLLMNAGLEEFIAYTEEEYVEKAVLLAGDTELLTGLRKNLRNILQKSDLMNQKQYVGQVEAMYRTLWDEQVQRENKEDVSDPMDDLWNKIYAGEYSEAEKLAEIMLETSPVNREIMEILVGIFIEQRRSDEARTMLKRLTKVHGNYAYQLFLQARLDYMREDWELVRKSGEEALQMAETASPEMISRIYNLLGNTYKNIGNALESVKSYKKAVRYAEGELNKAVDYSNYLFNLHYLQHVDAKEMYTAHIKYNQFFRSIPRYSHTRKSRHHKLRIGYISPDLRYHVVVFFSYAFFRHYNREDFEIYAYANSHEDAVSKDIASMVSVWKNVSSCSEEETARFIYEDQIDILVDLSGHTKGSCLPILAYKPAPVQISGIGYFDTTGLAEVDYFLADWHTDDPKQNEDYFSEQLLRLPASHFCYCPPDTMPDCQMAAPARTNKYLTFGSFNNFTKTTDEILILWKRIIDYFPKAKLLLKSRIFNSSAGCSQVKQRLLRLGYSLDQVDLRPETEDYLSQYNEIDIALDTYPYPGGGTTCEALYMGVPVITLVGKRHGARFGYSLLKNIGLDACCAFSKADYVNKAIALASDLEALDRLHGSLRQIMQASPLMQGKKYMEELEKLYIRSWEAFLQELPIDSPELSVRAIKKIERELEPAKVLNKDCRLEEKRYREAAALEEKIVAKKKYRHKRIRIGYISTDFCHSDGFYFYYQLLSEANREKFSIYCYSVGKIEDNYTLYCKQMAEKWHDMADCTPQDIAAQILSDEIDILVDISGTWSGKIAAVLAFQPAAVQVSAADFAALPGLEKTIFQITKANIDTPFCYTGRSDLEVLSETAAERNKYFTIGCFTPYMLWEDEVLIAWQELFAMNFDLKMQFFSECFSDPEMVKKAALRLAKIGYPIEKILFSTCPAEPLSIFTNLDLVLAVSKELPVLLCHALYMGVPVVALSSIREQEQHVQKILQSAGLEELVVENIEAQVEKASAILKDEKFLTVLHQNLRNIILRSPLMDGKEYTKKVEKWYKQVLQQVSND